MRSVCLSTDARRLLAALALGLSGGAHAQSPASEGFEERCRQLAETVQVGVVFEDAPVVWNTRLNEAELRQRATSTSGAHHTVLGLTVAKPTARTSVTQHALRDRDGRVCVAGSLQLRLGLSELRVYLASSLTDSCRRSVVEEHELEHVRVWRTHLRAGAHMAESLIRRQLTTPLYIEAGTNVEMALRDHVREIVAPVVERIVAVAAAAQRDIDTPASYRMSMDRLRTCPPAAQ